MCCLRKHLRQTTTPHTLNQPVGCDVYSRLNWKRHKNPKTLSTIKGNMYTTTQKGYFPENVYFIWGNHSQTWKPVSFTLCLCSVLVAPLHFLKHQVLFPQSIKLTDRTEKHQASELSSSGSSGSICTASSLDTSGAMEHASEDKSKINRRGNFEKLFQVHLAVMLKW